MRHPSMSSSKIFALSLLFHTYKVFIISNYYKYPKGLASPPRSLPLVGGRRFTSLRWDASPFVSSWPKAICLVGGPKAMREEKSVNKKRFDELSPEDRNRTPLKPVPLREPVRYSGTLRTLSAKQLLLR
jgi:hypothetical protein